MEGIFTNSCAIILMGVGGENKVMVERGQSSTAASKLMRQFNKVYVRQFKILLNGVKHCY